MKIQSKFLAAIFLGVLVSCEKESNNVDTAKSFDLVGNWETVNAPIIAQLRIDPDSTFHVNLSQPANITAYGELVLPSNENTVTFINISGNDSAATNPYPGTYNYAYFGDTLRFTVISDTLSRRMTMLSNDWIRKQ